MYQTYMIGKPTQVFVLTGASVPGYSPLQPYFYYFSPTVAVSAFNQSFSLSFK